MKIKALFWNTRELYELKTRQIVLDARKQPDIKAHMVSTLDSFWEHMNLRLLFEKILKKEIDINVVIQRDEHGFLWGTQKDWKEFVHKCNSIGIKTLMYDFGYFDHYESYMVDTYGSVNTGSIFFDWPNISGNMDWGLAPEYIQEYRDDFLKKLENEKNSKPVNDLKSGQYVVIWPQYSMDLIRPELREGLDRKTEVTDWVNKMCDAVIKAGLTPVVKGGPAMDSWSRFSVNQVKTAPVFAHKQSQLKKNPNAKFEKEINIKLIAHAKYHIINCSSVSNELVLANAPVIATGRSWFSGLEVFIEPKSWDSILDDTVTVNEQNRNKWCNWWFTRQVKKDDVWDKIKEIYMRYPIY